MAINVSFYLKRPKDDKKTVVYAHIWYSGRQLRYYLPETIHPSAWNPKAQKARETKSYKQYPQFNATLKNRIADIEATIMRYALENQNQVPEPTELKHLLNRVMRPSEYVEVSHTVLSFFRSIIERSKDGTRPNPKTGKPIAAGTIVFYTQTLNRLTEFLKGKDLSFDDVDMSFYKRYVEWMTIEKKLAANTIGKQVKTIKLIMNEAQAEGLTTNNSHKSKNFISASEDSESIYLNPDELAELKALDLSDNPRLDKVRDLFLVGCYTGLRFSDYSILRPEHIKDGLIKITQVKTGGKVTVPVHSEVEAILAKYNGSLPATISNQRFNEYIKEIASRVDLLQADYSISYTKGGKRVTETKPKYKFVETHTARRSFATNEYKAGTPTLTIMAITGHKTEKSFLKYIKVTPDEHAKHLQQIWKERGNK